MPGNLVVIFLAVKIFPQHPGGQIRGNAFRVYSVACMHNGIAVQISGKDFYIPGNP